MCHFPLTCVWLRLTHIFRNSSCSGWVVWRGWRWARPHPRQLSPCWPGVHRVLVVLVGAAQRTCFSGEAREESRPSPRGDPSASGIFTLEALQLPLYRMGPLVLGSYQVINHLATY